MATQTRLFYPKRSECYTETGDMSLYTHTDKDKYMVVQWMV